MKVPFTISNPLLIASVIYVTLFVSALFSCSCLAQAPVFQHMDMRDGLAQNTVLSIIQDARGFMWFGTTGGLNRYDSRTLRVYRNDPANPHSISSNYVSSSFCDSHQNLWLGTPNGLNKYNSKTDSFQRFSHQPAVKSSLTHNHIYCIYEDSKGRMWIGTAHGLNRLLDRSANRFEHYFLPGSTAQNTINSIREDHAGNLWLATEDGLVRMTVDKNNVHYSVFRHKKEVVNSLSDNVVADIAIDVQQTIWIGTKSGELDRYDPFTESFTHFREAASAGTLSAHNELNCLHMDKAGTLWIGSVEGIIRLDPSSMKFTHYQNDPSNPQSLGDNSVYSIFRDSQGSIWAGTYYSGIAVLHPDNTPFHVLKTNRSAKSLSSKRVNCIAEDQQHNLWIGADGEGLDYVNRRTGLVTHYKAGPDPTKNLPSNQVKAVYIDKAGFIWVGMRRGGLSRMDPAHHQWTTYHYSPDLNIDYIHGLSEDDQQRLWCLAYGRLRTFDKLTGTFQIYDLTLKQTPATKPAATINPVYYLFEDSRKNMWLGARGGMYLLRDKNTHVAEWIPFTSNPRTGNLSDHGIAYTVHEDNRGQIWVGTINDGLKLFDAINNTFTDYTETYGLPTTTIKAIQSDSSGLLWLTTNQGLIRFDPTSKRSQTYTFTDGIPGSEFEAQAAYRGADGHLYFGSNDGLLYFNPTTIKLNNHAPAIVFTSLEVGNKPIQAGDESNLLASDISLTDRLIFNYQQNFFTITFAVLNYIKSEKNQYAYKLEDLDREWHHTKTPSITYNNLLPGEYTLVVKGTNNDGVWSKKSAQIRIIILPPWWKTWWAYGLYLLLFAIILYSILRFVWLRNIFNREQELHQAKLNFFTNISHEIRTHLTLIIGPIDVLLHTKKNDVDVQKQLTYAKISSDSLLNLVTELMDFRKAESNQITLHVSQNDIIAYLKNSITPFQHLSEKQNITFSFSSNKPSIVLWFDSEQLAKVIHNLLSNAYKFISDGGEIHINVEEKSSSVQIEISDNGKGISAENVKKLFNNYFQVYDYGSQNTGYGIGLALSRNIMELHHGTLSVESKEATDKKNGFTCFTIMLRKGHSHFTKEQLINKTSPVIV